jgi:hypothetical protein
MRVYLGWQIKQRYSCVGAGQPWYTRMFKGPGLAYISSKGLNMLN